MSIIKQGTSSYCKHTAHNYYETKSNQHSSNKSSKYHTTITSISMGRESLEQLTKTQLPIGAKLETFANKDKQNSITN